MSTKILPTKRMSVEERQRLEAIQILNCEVDMFEGLDLRLTGQESVLEKIKIPLNPDSASYEEIREKAKSFYDVSEQTNSQALFKIINADAIGVREAYLEYLSDKLRQKVDSLVDRAVRKINPDYDSLPPKDKKTVQQRAGKLIESQKIHDKITQIVEFNDDDIKRYDLFAAKLPQFLAEVKDVENFIDAKIKKLETPSIASTVVAYIKRKLLGEGLDKVAPSSSARNRANYAKTNRGPRDATGGGGGSSR